MEFWAERNCQCYRPRSAHRICSRRFVWIAWDCFLPHRIADL